ncbi:hypothetical protein BD410DRAFT_49825 [Rickenella mellea]|uniref:DUF6593 domain-containing protein n=1 Tax=Rickenella mellea TaxID=50990 RepID=A0A4R5XFV7_9AGAM|nr:hypothetical protein BD410DRAFT_49825 [Rickenella mellea]
MSYQNTQMPPQPQGGWTPSGPPSGPPQPYGAPPQWTPQAPQWGSPQPQWSGAPPQQQWAGTPPPQPQWTGGPPQQPQQQWTGGPPQQQWGAGAPQQQWGPKGYQQPSQGPPQASHPVFRFTSPDASILNTTVLDPNGQVAFTVSSDKKHTEIRDQQSQVIASIDWSHSNPVLQYRGEKFKAKEWVPLNKKKTSRALTHQGIHYEWVEENDNKAFLTSATGQRVVIWNDVNDTSSVELLPDGMKIGILEPAVVALVIMLSKRSLGDGGGSGLTGWGIALGGAIGTLLA